MTPADLRARADAVASVIPQTATRIHLALHLRKAADLMERLERETPNG